MGKSIGQVFAECNQDKVVSAFETFWNDTYSDRVIDIDFKVDLYSAMNELAEISQTVIPPREVYNIVGNWKSVEMEEWRKTPEYNPEFDIDEEDDYYHVFAVKNTDDIYQIGTDYSLMGTDWNEQAHWIFDLNNFKHKEGTVLSCEEILARILYELTFFGHSREEIAATTASWNDPLEANFDKEEYYSPEELKELTEKE